MAHDASPQIPLADDVQMGEPEHQSMPHSPPIIHIDDSDDDSAPAMAEASKTTFTEDQSPTTAHCLDPSETVDENLPQPEVNEALEEQIEEPVVE